MEAAGHSFSREVEGTRVVLTGGSSEEDPAKIWAGCQLRAGGGFGAGGRGCCHISS